MPPEVRQLLGALQHQHLRMPIPCHATSACLQCKIGFKRELVYMLSLLVSENAFVQAPALSVMSHGLKSWPAYCRGSAHVAECGCEATMTGGQSRLGDEQAQLAIPNHSDLVGAAH